MFKVLVVEDEPPILRMVKSCVESADPDFAVTGCCMNGQSAVEALLNEDYDVVLTDVKMPVMTGIELAGWIHENKPKTRVVLLSGYSDFEYARKALAYKVFDYLLKPVSRQKMRELTDRLRVELTGRSAVSGERSTAVILACAGAYSLYESEVMLPGEGFWSDERIEGFMERALSETEGYIFFNSNFPSERFIVVESDERARQENIVQQLYESFKDGEVPVTLIYKKGVPLKNAGKSFALLRERLIGSLILGRSQIICCDGMAESYKSIEQPYSKRDVEMLADAVGNGNMDEIRERCADILERSRSAQFTQEGINNFLSVAVDTYAFDHPNGIRRETADVKREFVNALAGFTTYAALLDDVVSIFMSLRREKKSSDRYERLADEVEDYLVKNYAKNITCELLSKEFGFVPSYLSRIFKNHKGVSPNEYLTRYRIELAKELLSDNPEMRIKEVALAVGFKEAYYFSKTFKRETGMWPTELVKEARVNIE